MQLTPRFETRAATTLIGMRMEMSFADNQTGALWRQFMPRRDEIQNPAGTELYSAEVYPEGYFAAFNPQATFEKWAAVAVSQGQEPPTGMETLTVPGGLYAVFLHRGPASAGPQTYQYIYGTWLPASDYTLDERPHLAVMGEKYKNEDPTSEEDLWTPVKPR